MGRRSDTPVETPIPKTGYAVLVEKVNQIISDVDEIKKDVKELSSRDSIRGKEMVSLLEFRKTTEEKITSLQNTLHCKNQQKIDNQDTDIKDNKEEISDINEEVGEMKTLLGKLQTKVASLVKWRGWIAGIFFSIATVAVGFSVNATDKSATTREMAKNNQTSIQRLEKNNSTVVSNTTKIIEAIENQNKILEHHHDEIEPIDVDHVDLSTANEKLNRRDRENLKRLLQRAGYSTN